MVGLKQERMMGTTEEAKPLFPSDEQFTETTTSVLRQLHELGERTDKLHSWNPIRCFSQLRRITTELEGLLKDYYRCLEHSYVQMSTKVTGGVEFAVAAVGQNLLAGSLPFFLRLESSWRRVQSAVEYKRAYVLAILALYIAVVSVILSVLGVLLSFMV